MNQITPKNTPELQEVPKLLRQASTILGLVLISFVIISTGLYAFDKENKPSPDDLQASTFLGIGIACTVLFNLPWTKIRVGEFEIERVIEEQATAYSTEISKIKSTMQELIEAQRSGQAQPKMIQDTISEYESQKEQIRQYLEKHNTWGYSVDQLKHIAQQEGNTELDLLNKLEPSKIHILAGELIQSGDIRPRLSRNQQLLYQARSQEES